MPPPTTYYTPGSTAPPSPPAIPGTPIEAPVVEPAIQPYLCFGFNVADTVVYLSDVSYIPEDVWSLLNRPTRDDSRAPGPPVLVLDCLRLTPHTSHLGVAQSIEIARRMEAARTYLLGFGHEVSHEEYVTITEAVGGRMKHKAALTANEKEGIALIPDGESVWVRPAYDGLRIYVSEDLQVGDEEYQ